MWSVVILSRARVKVVYTHTRGVHGSDSRTDGPDTRLATTLHWNYRLRRRVFSHSSSRMTRYAFRGVIGADCRLLSRSLSSS